MANRYWVGGSGTWNTTSTTNWSATSGGAGGASVPTAADSVFFDRTGTYTVTMTGALTCLDFTVTVGSSALSFNAGTSPTLAVSGSFSLISGITWNSTGTITFNATTTGKTVTTNGSQLNCPVVFDGAGGGWTLGSALSLTAFSVTVTTGTFDTGNYNITCTAFSCSGTNTRTVNLGSSTLTLFTNNAVVFSAGVATNLTFNAGTSQINCSGLTTSSQITSFAGGGVTFNNVAFTGSLDANGQINITGFGTTFNN